METYKTEYKPQDKGYRVKRTGCRVRQSFFTLFSGAVGQYRQCWFKINRKSKHNIDKIRMSSGWKRNACNWNYWKCPQIADLCALMYQSVQKHISTLKLHNFKMGNRFHIAPQNALFCVYGIIKVTLLKIFRKILKSFWKLIDKSWTQCYSMYIKKQERN